METNDVRKSCAECENKLCPLFGIANVSTSNAAYQNGYRFQSPQNDCIWLLLSENGFN